MVTNLILTVNGVGCRNLLRSKDSDRALYGQISRSGWLFNFSRFNHLFSPQAAPNPDVANLRRAVLVIDSLSVPALMIHIWILLLPWLDFYCTGSYQRNPRRHLLCLCLLDKSLAATLSPSLLVLSHWNRVTLTFPCTSRDGPWNHWWSTGMSLWWPWPYPKWLCGTSLALLVKTFCILILNVNSLFTKSENFMIIWILGKCLRKITFYSSAILWDASSHPHSNLIVGIGVVFESKFHGHATSKSSY